jgi:TolA-binding protein
MTADTIQKYMKLQSKKESENPEVDETLQQIEQLEERIRVLERIVTENRYDLKKEIDKL